MVGTSPSNAGCQVQTLVGELRFYKLCGVVKKIKKDKQTKHRRGSIQDI